MKEYKITIRTVHSALDIALGATNTATTYTVRANSLKAAEKEAQRAHAETLRKEVA